MALVWKVSPKRNTDERCLWALGEELFRQKEQLQAGIGLLGNSRETGGDGQSSKSRGGVDEASGETGVGWVSGEGVTLDAVSRRYPGPVAHTHSPSYSGG